MAMHVFTGGLSADLLLHIDDPFSGPAHHGAREETRREEAPQEDLPFEEDCVSLPEPIDDPFEASMAAPVSSRPSGLITLPMALFETRERSPSARRSRWPEHVMVLGLSGIIVAASVTAVREYATDPHVAVWLARAASVISALSTRATAIARDPSQRERSRAADSKVEAPAPVAGATELPNGPEEHRETSAPIEPPTPREAAPQAAVPQQLPEIVFSSRSHVRVTRTHAGRAASTRTHKAAKPTASEADGARSVQASTIRTEAREHYAARRYAQAIAAYESAAKLEPGHALTFAGIAAARLQLGDVRGAIKAYERAVLLSPGSAALHTGLAQAYLRDGNTRRARASCGRARALDSEGTAANVTCAGL